MSTSVQPPDFSASIDEFYALLQESGFVGHPELNTIKLADGVFRIEVKGTNPLIARALTGAFSRHAHGNWHSRDEGIEAAQQDQPVLSGTVVCRRGDGRPEVTTFDLATG